MTEITNPQVIRFSNETVRPLCDALYKAYYKAKSGIEDYNAADIGTKIDTAGAGNLIADGSDTDGRTRITGGDIYNIITALTHFVAYVEGNAVTTANRLDVITKPHVNGI